MHVLTRHERHADDDDDATLIAHPARGWTETRP